VLESKERAVARGAKPRARLLAVESERTARKPGAAAQIAEGSFARILPQAKPGALAVLSGASGRGTITHEERAFLAAIAGDTGLPVRGTAAAFGHAMESAPLQNVALAVAALERRALFPPLEPDEPIEAEFDGNLRQVLVTSWGHAKGEGMVLVEAIDG
jgi:3-oxoacyl-[acyl-carrier-protein] synthase II